MSITRIAREGTRFALARVASGGSQNFLGAPWVAHLVDGSPERVRERVALRLLSLSPHYIYDHDLGAEAERNRQSRRALAETIIFPHLTGDAHVIDYGCGPGYLARAVAEKAGHVTAADISSGVLACAKALNGRANISYLTIGELRQASRKADLAYSFAVAQHLRTDVLIGALDLLADQIRSGGTLLMHFAMPGLGGWRTQADWEADRSLMSRAKLRYGLHCFGRPADEMEALVSASGFTGIATRPLSGSVNLPGGDDVADQHLLTACRR